jgi:hypothetical protein
MNIYLGVPQLIYIILQLMSLGLIVAKWGQPMPQRNPYGWPNIVASVISVAFLYWGGFFG